MEGLSTTWHPSHTTNTGTKIRTSLQKVVAWCGDLVTSFYILENGVSHSPPTQGCTYEERTVNGALIFACTLGSMEARPININYSKFAMQYFNTPFILLQAMDITRTVS